MLENSLAKKAEELPGHLLFPAQQAPGTPSNHSAWCGSYPFLGQV